MHYRQLMTLDIGNDALLCKVFPASLQGQALSWFHRLPPNSVGNFRDLSEAFVGQYLCSAQHKQNISTLQNIKMQDNESLREFVKRFGQAVLQVEACSMDVVLQIFKRSICPGTPFFESLAKKPPTTMDDLFRRANKYSMLEDDVRAATQQVLVAGRPSRGDAERNAKPPDRPRPSDRRQEGRVAKTQGTDPSTRDRSKRCAFHKEHGHTTETCRASSIWAPAAPKAVINYINGGPSDEEYDSRRKRQKLLRAASIRERINSIRPGLTGGGPRPIDGTIIFPPVDPTWTLQPHRDALILSLEIGDFDVRRILVDPGSSADLVQASVVSHMGHSITGLENPGRILSGSTDRQPHPWETLYYRSKLAQSLSTYNSRGTRVITLQCHFGAHMAPLHESYPLDISLNAIIGSGGQRSPGSGSLTNNPNFGENTHLTNISSLMTIEETQSIQNILIQNHDIFAWAHSDMKGIHPSIASHRLNVFSAARPVRQKIRRFHPDRQEVIRNEIDKLLNAGFIREVSYPDCFPLPRIDQIVDSTSGQGMLSFLDAFSGYHQIPMSPDDEEKTAFITPHDLYCYKVMSFGLKNAGATYQKLMTKIFKPLICHTVEVYIDDIVVKSKTREQHVLHLQEVFHLLRKYDMKLNPSKCAFGVSAGKFLGFMVNQRGIEVSPDQVKAVMETPPPRNKKELQRLTGKLVALGRFIARFTDELRPFFLAIRKAGAHGWTDSCQNAFEKIKHCLTQPPILSSPIPKEKLYMYLAVSEWAISAVLFAAPRPRSRNLSTTSAGHWQT
ncbi:Retrovirus-related Pol polyprotein from transposon 17.6 [Vitis vinifera]|uniref:Retrovirus-related Pol polyprotein from transposon 17.6 n=2 Tax=Vitis vinifera TaxID=29760 RepID=A0A438KA74_VITVI|nr:Retrovirus-related Pol polyprotein from transposon 17.6 [Vitis vinifera]